MAFSEDSSSFVFSQKDEDDFALVSAMEKDWIELRRVREREEVERWFYVALTRARLSVTLTWNQNELTENSWVGLFNLLKFESDSSLRRLGPFEEHQELASSEPLEAPRSPYKRQEASDDLERSRASFSKMSSDENIRWTHKSLRNKYASQAKGIHWHRLFESLKFSGVEDGLKEFPFLNNLKTPPLKEVISSGHVEWGFQSKVNSKVIEGQIDLWGFDKKGHLWVIDYKTGSLKSKEKAILQVQFYLWVLKHGQLAQKDFHWAVIYPFEEKVLSGEMTTEDFINLEVELGLSQ
ncbi:MAG: hypothetical protein GW917_01680 [Bdellovibrionales bacterium]|nr:hypothetical protein [Bdellovibrionales bacterium]